MIFTHIRFCILFLVQIFCFIMFLKSWAGNNLMNVCFFGILMLSLESETSRLLKEIKNKT